jgi:hypothetical protein
LGVLKVYEFDVLDIDGLGVLKGHEFDKLGVL